MRRAPRERFAGPLLTSAARRRHLSLETKRGGPVGPPRKQLQMRQCYQMLPDLQPPLLAAVQARTEAPPPTFVMVKFVPDFEYAVMT